MDCRITASVLLTLLSPVALAAPGETTLVSINDLTGQAGGGDGAKSSVDGRYVLYSGLVLRDRETQRSVRVDVNTAGVAANRGSYPVGFADYDLSGDGRYVSFTSDSTNLVSGDTNGGPDVFLRDVIAGTTERVTVSSNGAQQGAVDHLPNSSLSDDGRFVAFDSVATNLVPGTSGYVSRVYYRDRLNRATRLASGNLGWCVRPEFSGDGRSLGFECAPKLADGSLGRRQAYVLDLPSAAIQRVSVNSAGEPANQDSSIGGLSGDGRYVVVVSDASNLVPGDTNGNVDVFLRDREARTTERVSVSSTGAQQTPGPLDANLLGTVSDDGRFVAFISDASNLVIGDTNTDPDVFVRDRTERTTTRVNVATDGTQAEGYTFHAQVSRDGRFVFFDSNAVLTPDDSNLTVDVFVHELGATRPPPATFTLKPRAGLDFGTQRVGTSVTLRLWLRNTGPVPVPIDSVRVGGTNAAEFQVRHSCGKSVAVGDGCSISVTFSPTSVGPKSARVRVVSGDTVRRRDLVGVAVF